MSGVGVVVSREKKYLPSVVFLVIFVLDWVYLVFLPAFSAGCTRVFLGFGACSSLVECHF